MVWYFHHRLHAGFPGGVVLHGFRCHDRFFLVLALQAHRLFHNGWWRHKSDSLFKFLDDGKQVAGFKWLDDHAVRFYAIGVFRFVRLHLADRQQHRCLQRVKRSAHLLADFQPGISRHVDIKNDDVRFLFRDFLYRGRAVAHCHNVITGIGKDFLVHILGSHAVIGK